MCKIKNKEDYSVDMYGDRGLRRRILIMITRLGDMNHISIYHNTHNLLPKAVTLP